MGEELYFFRNLSGVREGQREEERPIWNVSFCFFQTAIVFNGIVKDRML